MTKPIPDIVIDRLGTHLFKVTRKDGASWLKWHWETLEEEVRSAIAAYEGKGSKRSIIEETEAKVKKTRAKRVDPSPETLDQWNAEIAKAEKSATKKPAARKPAAKKPAAKKAATKKSK